MENLCVGVFTLTGFSGKSPFFFGSFFFIGFFSFLVKKDRLIEQKAQA